ncbi:MAG: hypothetical protein HRT51_19970 [Colwellia sp.]|nr:hypothetical protein [Colwellia sp.]
MPKSDIPLFHLVKSAKLAYYMSDHSDSIATFMRNWFKQKVKTQKDSLTSEQIQVICSDWKVNNVNFYKNAMAFLKKTTDKHALLARLSELNDQERLCDLCSEFEKNNHSVFNSLIEEDIPDTDIIQKEGTKGIFIIKKQSDKFDEHGNIINELCLSIRVKAVVEVHLIKEIIMKYGFEIISIDKFSLNEFLEIVILSSKANHLNTELLSLPINN